MQIVDKGQSTGVEGSTKAPSRCYRKNERLIPFLRRDRPGSHYRHFFVIDTLNVDTDNLPTPLFNSYKSDRTFNIWYRNHFTSLLQKIRQTLFILDWIEFHILRINLTVWQLLKFFYWYPWGKRGIFISPEREGYSLSIPVSVFPTKQYWFFQNQLCSECAWAFIKIRKYPKSLRDKRRKHKDTTTDRHFSSSSSSSTFFSSTTTSSSHRSLLLAIHRCWQTGGKREGGEEETRCAAAKYRGRDISASGNCIATDDRSWRGNVFPAHLLGIIRLPSRDTVYRQFYVYYIAFSSFRLLLRTRSSLKSRDRYSVWLIHVSFSWRINGYMRIGYVITQYCPIWNLKLHKLSNLVTS